MSNELPLPATRMSTKQLLDRLQRHYIKPSEPMPGGVFVPECGWNDGGRQRSRVDALYVGFTSSSGRMLVGHELKVSRADWRHELDQPGKADPWHDQCHAWYVVAPSTEIVPAEELPDGWGLMVPNPRSKVRMDIVVKARTYPQRNPSWEAMRSLLARQDTLRAQTIQSEIQQARQRETERVEKQYAQRYRGSTDLPQDVRDRLAALEKIEQHLGQEISLYSSKLPADVAARAIRIAHAEQDLSNVTARPSWELRGAENAAQAVLDRIAAYREAIAEVAAQDGAA